MDWKKHGRTEFVAQVDTRFSLVAAIMPDGRWTWKIKATGALAPMATGIVSTPGAAKHAMENFLKKKLYI
jgi:hypothetical protein